MKKALIEFGRKKISLVVLEVKGTNFCNVEDEFSEKMPLGDEIDAENLIRPLLIKEIMKILKSYRKICDAFGITDISAFAPNFFANARNLKSFTEEIYNTVGFNLQILTPEEEIKCLFCGAVNCSDLPKGIFFNIGEYKTNIVQFNRRNMLNFVTLPFGARDVSKELETKPKEEVIISYRQKFEEEIEKIEFLKEIDSETSFLTSGDLFLNIGKLARKATHYPLDLQNNHVVTKEIFDNVYGLINGLEIDKTKKLKGISEDSADRLFAGLALSKIFFDKMSVSQFSISEDGIREGYIYDIMIPEIFDRPLSEMFTYSLENINAFFKVPNSNNIQVYELAINVFKQLKVIHKLPRNYVKALRIAAYMYDCGKRISQDNFEKNGFFVILNSKIKGVSQKDLLLASFACAYQNLDNFNLSEWVRYSSIVSEQDLDAVKKIGVIIQLSSALDCTKGSVIEDLSCDILGDSIIMKTIITKDAEYEIREATKVNSNFKKVFTKFLEVI